MFSHQTALALHDLSDAILSRLHLTWRRRRLRVPESVAELAEAERSWFGPVPVTTPLRTLNDCADAHLSPDQLRQAARDALRRGLVTRAELAVRGAGVTQEYRTAAAAFKQVLEQRLRTTSRSGVDFARRRQLLAL